MNPPRLLAALGAGNTTALVIVVGWRTLSDGQSVVLPLELFVTRVLPVGLVAGLLIFLGALRYLDGVDGGHRPVAGAYAAPGYAVPAVSAVRDASTAVFPPPSAIDVAVVGVVSATAMYVLAWFAEGPDAQ